MHSANFKRAFTLILLATTAAPTFAQTPPAEDETGLGEIIVTAQRRDENLQDVPLSVTAIGGEKLGNISAAGADIRFLSARVPSLIVESSFGRTFPRFYIRGLGNTDFDFNASQPVSLVYDDVVLENPILKGFPVFDIAQVEVLRGPQGTLFGRNTPAGIVKFDSVKPGKETNGYLRASYGRFNQVSVEGAVGGQLSGDKAAARLSVLYQRQDNYVDNVLPGRTTKNALEGYNEFAGRLQLLLKPSEELDVLLSGQLRTLNGTARVFRANVFTRGQTGLNANFNRFQVSTDGKNNQEVNTYNGTARITYDAGPVSLFSVTSYWDGNATSVGDVDGGFGASFLPPNLTGPGVIPFTAETRDAVPKLKQFTQEFRIASNGDGALSYQGGVFYFDETLRILSDNFSTLGDFVGGVGLFTPPGGINITVDQRQKSKAYGVFASVTYAVTDALKLTGGIRYNNDKRTFSASRVFDSFPFDFFLAPPLLGTVNRRTQDDNITWDIAANYKATDDVSQIGRAHV